MTAKEYLGRAKAVEQHLNAAMRKVELYKAMAEKVNASIGGEQVSHTRDVTSNENAIIRLVEARERVVELQAEYQVIVGEIEEMLSQLPNPDWAIILEHHYLKHQSFATIARLLHVSRSSVYNYYGEALSALNKIL